jgi:hypothetical protein
MTDQKVFVSKPSFCCVAEGRQCRREFSVRTAPSRDIIYCSIKHFEERGRECNKLANGSKQFFFTFV